MSALLVIRSVIGSLVRRPLWWLYAALLAASWPALRTFLPLGLATADLHQWTAAYEIAFLGGIAAIVGGMGPLAQLQWMLQKAGAVRRTALEVLALVTCAAALGVFALIPAHLFDVWQFPSFRADESLAALLIGWLHVAVVATTVLRAPIDPTARAGIVILATCLFPGLLVGDAWAGRFSLSALDAGGTLRASFDFPLAHAHRLAAGVPVVGWGATAIALASPPAPLPAHVHALRDTR